MKVLHTISTEWKSQTDTRPATGGFYRGRTVGTINVEVATDRELLRELLNVLKSRGAEISEELLSLSESELYELVLNLTVRGVKP